MSGPFFRSQPPPLPQPTKMQQLETLGKYHGPSSTSFPYQQPFTYDKPLHHPSVTGRQLTAPEEGNRNCLMWAQYYQKEWQTCHVDGPSTRF